MKNKMVLLAILSTFFVIWQGCTDTTEEPTNETDIKYNPDVVNIMNNYCITCHGSSAPSSYMDLTTYENVKLYTETGNIIARINDADNPMPPSGLLLEDKRETIQKWVDNGFQE